MSASTRRRIRAEVCARADGYCEHCGVWVGLDGESAELDHQQGRGKGREKESVANCWLLCGAPRFLNGCHFKRTNNKPDAAYWWTAIVDHLKRRKLPTERAEDQLAWKLARAAS